MKKSKKKGWFSTLNVECVLYPIDTTTRHVDYKKLTFY